jgi:tetratricopeptide (TPR) repeat protein
MGKGRVIRYRLATEAAAVALCIALGGALGGCSSAPKAAKAVYELRNKAAELSKLGDSFLSKGVYDQAIDYYLQALKVNSSIDNLEGVAASKASLGRAYMAAGEPAAAERSFSDSLDYARMAGSKSGQAAAKAGLGELRYSAGEREAALSLFEEAVGLGAGDDNVLAIALHDAAVAKAALGMKEQARADLDRAAALNAKLRRWAELGTNRFVIASLLAGEGKLEEALAMALSALDADKAAENGKGVAADLAAAANLAKRLRRPAEAKDFGRRSFDAAFAIGDAAGVRTALNGLLALAAEAGSAEDEARYRDLLERLDKAEAGVSPAR